jgi:DNA-binding response OmpR family regulator
MTMKKRLLLLIEDNPLLTGMYRSAFEEAGFDVVVAHDGESGLQLAHAKIPEGIVLDLLMPGMPGLDVLKKLKGDKDTQGIGVVILTTDTKKDDLDEAKKLGALDCLIKSDLTLADIVARTSSFF